MSLKADGHNSGPFPKADLTLSSFMFQVMLPLRCSYIIIIIVIIIISFAVINR
jgi:hypothetical protein